MSKALLVLDEWLHDEKWHGRIVLATIHDTRTARSRHFVRDGDTLRELKADAGDGFRLH